MLPAAKALLVTVLVGGGTVGTYALAGGKFGTGGSGNAETTQTSTPEVTKPTVSEVLTSEDTALTSSSSSSTLVDGSAREDISDTSLGESSSRAGSEGQGQTKDNTTGKDGEIIAGSQGKNEKGDITSGQSKGSQVPESLPTAPAEKAQEATGSKGTDDQALTSVQQRQEGAQTKVTKESNGDQGNAEQKVNQEQATDAGAKSQSPSTDNENTNTVTRSQEALSGEETRTASGEEGRPSTEPGVAAS